MKKLFLLAMLAFVLLSMNTYSYTSIYLDGLWYDGYYKTLTYITLGTNSVSYTLTARGNPGAPIIIGKMFSSAYIWVYDKDGSQLKYKRVYNDDSYSAVVATGTVYPHSGSQVKKIKIAASSENIFCEDIVHTARATAYARWD